MCNTFKMLDGSVVVTERFMQGPRLGPDRHWYQTDVLVCVEGETYVEAKTYVEVMGKIPTVDVNAPNTIFGYEEKEFLARQYKRTPKKGANR